MAYRAFYSSPRYFQYGSGRGGRSRHPFHALPEYQTGQGIGGFLKGIWNFLMPVAKSAVSKAGSVASKVAGSSVAKSIAKDVTDTALKTGIELASSAIAGGGKSGGKKTNAKETLRERLGEVRKRTSEKIGKMSPSDLTGLLASDSASPSHAKKKRGRKKKKSQIVAVKPFKSLNSMLDDG